MFRKLNMTMIQRPLFYRCFIACNKEIMQKDTIFILAVALVTWGGVFAYLLRLHFLARALEAKVDALDRRDAQ
jgi:hypothetical protein